jgi:hypothetical protein
MIYTESEISSIENLISNYFENNKREIKNEDILLKYITHIKEWLKNKSTIVVYGGYSWNQFLDEEHKFYKEGEYHDIDLYSIQPKKDGVELVNYLNKLGCPKIKMYNAVNDGTYKISINHYDVLDITYIPDNLFKVLEIEKINEINFLKPNFLKMDLLYSLSNIDGSSYRWKKDFERLDYLEKAFPYEYKYENNLLKKKVPFNLRNDLIHFFQNKKDKFVYTGDIAYIRYMENSSLENYFRPYVKYPEICTNHIEELINGIKDIYKNSIEIRVYHPFLKLISKRYIVYHKETKCILLVIYDLNNKKIPYETIGTDKVIVYRGLELHYNTKIWLGKCYKIDDLIMDSKVMLYYLQEGRNYYMNIMVKTKLDDSVFEEFSEKYIGEQENKIIKYKEKKWNNESFNYIPEQREFIIEPDKIGCGKIRFICGEFEKNL